MKLYEFKYMKFVKLIIYSGILILFSFQQSETKLHSIIGKTSYPFWIQVPNTEIKEDLPILLFLHGKSLSGTDLNKVKRYGVLRAIEKGRKINAIVVAPQLASGSWNPDKVLEVLDYVQKNYKSNEKKVYVCGMSLGSYGTMHFVGKYPDRVTAAVSICGGGNIADACRLAKVPIWIQHGDKDFIVHMRESQKIYNAIKKCDEKADVKLTIISGGNHSNVENVFHQDTIYNWLFSK